MDAIIEGHRLLRVLEELRFCAENLQDYPFEQKDVIDAMDIVKKTAKILLDGKE